MKHNLRILPLGILLLSAVGVLAQTPPPTDVPEPPSLPKIFSKITGKNGYEELVAASDLVRNNKLLAAAQEAGARLEVRRRAIQSPEMVRARALLKVGLSKSIASPRKGIDDETLFPELAGFRNLARLLRIEQQVMLADGNVTGAIEDLRDGLQLGYRIQFDSLINGLVGIAVGAIVVDPMAKHLGQFSVRDCNEVITLVEEWLRAASPMKSLLIAERDGMLTILNKYKDRAQDFIPTMLPEPDDGETEPPETTALRERLKEHPEEGKAIFDEAAKRAAEHYHALIASLDTPVWERKPLPEPEDKSPAGMLFSAIHIDFNTIINRYAQEQASLRLLGVHAAIRRFQWQKNRLPKSLTDLGNPTLCTDPFSGKPLVYKLTDETYELYSIGPLTTGENGETGTARTPIYLPRKRTGQ